MDIAVISDTHFGYGWDTEREDDPFIAAEEAFEKSRDADLILVPGDVFDARTPRQEVLSQAADIFDIPQQYQSDAALVPDQSDKTTTFKGIPVVAIHGTHDRRSKGFVNPVELLEDFGKLLHLHTETVVFEKNGERVAVHGLSGVPEAYAADALKQWSPQPVPDAYNILLLHQNIEGFVYTGDTVPALALEDLPEGFDLIIDGHIHWPTLENRGERKNLVFAGSTIATQMTKKEAEQEKGFLTINTEEDVARFNALDTSRALHYEELDVTDMSKTAIMEAVRDIVTTHTEDAERKPLIRVVLTGSTTATVSPTQLAQAHQEEALLTVSRDLDTDTVDLGNNGGMELDGEHIFEHGMDILQDTFPSNTTDVTGLFDALSGGDLDTARHQLEDIPLDTLQTMFADTDPDEADGETSTGDGDKHGETGGTTQTLTAFTGDSDGQ